jgi:hypothetical protein
MTQTIQMVSIQSVLVDGVDVGSLASAIAACAPEDLQAAVVAWHDRIRAQLQKELDDARTSFSNALKATDTDFTARTQELQTTHAAALQATVDQCNQTMEEFRAKAQAQVDAYAAAAATAQAAQASAEREAAFQQRLQGHHWALSKAVMESGQTDSAIAAAREIRRCELVQRQAGLNAEASALGDHRVQ